MDWLCLVGIVSGVSILPKGGGTFSYFLVFFRFIFSGEGFILLLVLFLEVDRWLDWLFFLFV